jgi:NADPH:quinone reductase-like Zn-dependent oxidoreductase
MSSIRSLHPDGRQLGEIGKLLDAEHIAPVINKVFPFEQTKEALAYLEQGRAKGKVVVQLFDVYKMKAE